MLKNILFVEDDGRTLSLVEELEEIHHLTVYNATCNWKDVERWLTGKPGAASFAALIFDLKVPTYRLEQYGERIYNEALDFSPSLYFINQFIKPYYPQTLNRILIYSGFIKEAAKAVDLSSYKVFDKSSNINLVDDVLKLVSK